MTKVVRIYVDFILMLISIQKKLHKHIARNVRKTEKNKHKLELIDFLLTKIYKDAVILICLVKRKNIDNFFVVSRVMFEKMVYLLYILEFNGAEQDKLIKNYMNLDECSEKERKIGARGWSGVSISEMCIKLNAHYYKYDRVPIQNRKNIIDIREIYSKLSSFVHSEYDTEWRDVPNEDLINDMLRDILFLFGLCLQKILKDLDTLFDWHWSTRYENNLYIIATFSSSEEMEEHYEKEKQRMGKFLFYLSYLYEIVVMPFRSMGLKIEYRYIYWVS